MKTCKIRPSSGECNACVDTADFFGGTPNCGDCAYQKQRYVLVDIKPGFFGDYAFVQSNGRIIKVSLNKVYDIKEGE